VSSPVLEIDNVIKPFGGLRPLRLQQLVVQAGERVAVTGVDQTMAEVFVNLVTGATLPEQGVIKLSGRATSDIADSADWLATVDRFGIVSERVVLLDQFTLAQNIAMSLTLDLEPLAEEVLRKVEGLGREVGLDANELSTRAGDVGAASRLRTRLARAIATAPSTLLVEHPAANLAPEQMTRVATDIARLSKSRGIAVVVLAATPDLARPFVDRLLVLNAATGRLAEERRGVLGRLFGR
jgi:ABC-type transporter Mla maintaining outer membrane lipid asymmetry ATPase subunit MlaF